MCIWKQNKANLYEKFVFRTWIEFLKYIFTRPTYKMCHWIGIYKNLIDDFIRTDIFSLQQCCLKSGSSSKKMDGPKIIKIFVISFMNTSCVW